MALDIAASLDRQYGANGYILLKLAISGSPMTWEHANKHDWATESELPTRLIAELQAVSLSNPTAHAGGMIWVHGESDTRSGANPQLYHDRLLGLIDKVQQEVPSVGTAAALSFSKLHTTISQLAEMAPENFERLDWDTIIHQQAQVALSSDTIDLVDPDTVARERGFDVSSMFVDSLHYSIAYRAALADSLVKNVAEGHRALLNGQGTDGILLTGGGDADSLTGTALDDRISGKGGENRLFGLQGDDELFGGRLRDRIDGGDGDDVIWGYRGRDLLNGQVGDDRIYGGLGNDVANGGAGDDCIKGGGGSDRLTGGYGQDHLYGGSWGDSLFGGSGDDHLVGGNGRDVLAGGTGNDVLIGGLANNAGDGVEDVFVFETASVTSQEFDRVKGFENGIDKLDLSAFGFASFAHVAALSQGTPYGVELTLSARHFVIVEDFNFAWLTADDVIL
ncbi:MAG: calcium-binding protein [Pseudomonadota bacterium]